MERVLDISGLFVFIKCNIITFVSASSPADKHFLITNKS